MKKAKVSVIIPTLNEEKTIGQVVSLVKKQKSVTEVIVVDDKSFDRTVAEAKNAGAQVILSTKIGKGASMRDGLLLAKNEIITYLDGDVENYASDIVEKLVQPIQKNKADFVKSTFMRKAGRVTELVAKPLLTILFPQIANFTQPLSGAIAGRKNFFEKIKFEDDYGVDIGILLDMHLLGARMAEVNVGEIQHKMKPWHQLSKMSREVAKAILKRANNQALANLDSLEEINIIRDQMEYAIKETLLTFKKMIIFDNDNTILMGRFIDFAARKFGFENQLAEIRAKNQNLFLTTKQITQLLKGKTIAELLEVADTVPIVPDTVEVFKELKKRGYIVGIISDGYDVVVNHIKNKIGADFALANELEFSQSVATGEVKIPSFFIQNEKSSCDHNYCKSNALLHIAQQYAISHSNIVAVGDSQFDICMVKMAGVGVAFCSPNPILNSVADQQIEVKYFRPILEFAM